MKTVKYENGDISIIDGRSAFIEDKECLRQRLEYSLRLEKGSWFLAPAAGIPWFSIYNNKKSSVRMVKSFTKKVLKADEDVTAITELSVSLNRSTRELEVAFKVQSSYGEVSGSV